MNVSPQVFNGIELRRRIMACRWSFSDRVLRNRWRWKQIQILLHYSTCSPCMFAFMICGIFTLEAFKIFVLCLKNLNWKAKILEFIIALFQSSHISFLTGSMIKKFISRNSFWNISEHLLYCILNNWEIHRRCSIIMTRFSFAFKTFWLRHDSSGAFNDMEAFIEPRFFTSFESTCVDPRGTKFIQFFFECFPRCEWHLFNTFNSFHKHTIYWTSWQSDPATKR